MKRRAWLLLAVLVAALAVSRGGRLPAASAAPQQDGENLLQNPSFEGQYSAWNQTPQIQMPAAWTPWWVEAGAGELNWVKHRPEWKPAEAANYPGRVHGGERALQWHKSYATFLAGAYQQVSVPADAPLRFSAYGQAWSCSDYSLCNEGGGVWSQDPAHMNMQIGIDPTGGTNPWGSAVVWSGTANPLDAYRLFQVEAVAQGSTVTVFLYSYPDWPKQNQDVYFDDASLVVIGDAQPQPATATSAQSSAPAPAPAVEAVPVTVATPRPDGSIVHVVQSGQTLWVIAVHYGVALDDLRAYNDVGAFLHEGDELIIRPASAAPEPAPEPTSEPTVVEEEAAAGEPEAVPETAAAEPENPEPPAEPVAAAPQPAAAGAICVSAFDDRNANGVRDEGEGLLAGVSITVSDDRQVMGNYTTDGSSEPYCFGGLMPGSYQVIQLVADSWTATAPASQGAVLHGGDVVSLEFGNVAIQSGALAAAESDSGSESAQDSTKLRLRSSVLTGVGVLGILLMVGAGLLVLFSRRRQTPTEQLGEETA